MATIEYELSRRKREVAADFNVGIEALHQARLGAESERKAKVLSFCIFLLEEGSRQAQKGIR